MLMVSSWWNRWVLRREWDSEGVLDDDSGESTETVMWRMREEMSQEKKDWDEADGESRCLLQKQGKAYRN